MSDPLSEYERGVAAGWAKVGDIIAGLLEAARADFDVASGARQQNYYAGALALVERLAEEVGLVVESRVNEPPKSKTQRKMAPFLDRLGKEPDRTIAMAAGVTMATVARYRKSRGIPTFIPPKVPAYIPSPQHPRKHPAWQDVVRDRLGKVPDTTLADEAGVSRERIRQFRASLGIAADPTVKSDALAARARPLPEEARPWFGVLPDIEICRRLQVHPFTISRWRKRYDLPKSPVERVRRSKLEDHLHRFGVEDDKAIARAAGVSPSALFQYRLRHPELPLPPRSRKRSS